MKSYRAPRLLLFLLVLAAACGGEGTGNSRDETADAPGEIIRGFYTFGHEVRELIPCGKDEAVWVVDRTGLLKELYGNLVPSQKGDRKIFVIATGTVGPPPDEGFGAEYPGAAVVDEVIYAALEGFGCDLDLSTFHFRAYGNEPFWSVMVLREGMTLARPGAPDLFWPEVTWEADGDVVVLRGVGGKVAGILTVAPGPAYDSMSGAYFSRRATFEIEGEKLEGNALKGLAGNHGQPH